MKFRQSSSPLQKHHDQDQGLIVYRQKNRNMVSGKFRVHKFSFRTKKHRQRTERDWESGAHRKQNRECHQYSNDS